MEYIVIVTLVPFSISPMYHIPVSLSYVPLLLTYSNSFGRMSLSVTFVALVPFAALVTVMVQVTVSFTLHSSLSTVFVTDTSTIGFTFTDMLTVWFVPFGVLIVKLLNFTPIAFAWTFTVIVAFPFAVMFVITQVMTWPLTFCPSTTSAPLIPVVFMKTNPSSRLSITVMLSVYVMFPVFITVRLYSTIS